MKGVVRRGVTMTDRSDRFSAGGESVRLYWATWAALLALTLVMLLLDTAPVARPWLVAVLLVAMLAKVALIAGNFMHLRHAHAGLVWTFIAGLLITGLTLYVLIVPDALRIRDMLVNR